MKNSLEGGNKRVEHLEVIVFDEIDDYSEKIKGLTFRQWIFVAITIIVVVPTYLLIPKYTFLTKDIVSYIVIFEAAIIGFLGFIKIQGLNAEQIIPFWYRHFLLYKKPLEYITDEDWKKAHEKKGKKQNKSNVSEVQNKKIATTEVKDIDNQEKQSVTVHNVESKQKLTKKQLKKKAKQEKMLKKAEAKYGYLFDDDNSNNKEKNIDEDKLLTESDISKEQSDNKGVDENNKENVTNDKNSNIEDILDSLSPEEKKEMLKKLVNIE